MFKFFPLFRFIFADIALEVDNILILEIVCLIGQWLDQSTALN